MRPVFDAFWRAALYCVHPRVIVLSLIPLVLLATLTMALVFFGWDWAVAGVNGYLQSSGILSMLLGWLSFLGAGGLKAVVAPLFVLAIAVPVMVVLCLLAVSVFMTPAVVKLVGDRRFATLEQRAGSPFWQQVLWSLWSTFLALAMLVVSLPLWLIPPLALLLPPLIWGWLSYRVLSFDALSNHASSGERHQLIKTHRTRLYAMGVFTGFLGAAPGVVGASGAMSVVLAPILLPLAIWVYTLVFAFASAWFAHYCLAALQHLRAENALKPPVEKALEPLEMLPPLT